MISPRTSTLRRKNKEFLDLLRESTTILDTYIRGRKGYDEIQSWTERMTVNGAGDLSARNQAWVRRPPFKSDLSSKHEIPMMLDGDPSYNIPPVCYEDLRNIVRKVLQDIPCKAYDNFEEESIAPEKNVSDNQYPSLACFKERGRSKSLLLEQRLAADAQMHAPTHSHSISKCYCRQTGVGLSVAHTSRKQNIPPRVRERRYRVEPMRKHSRTVKWAEDCHDRNCASFAEDNDSCKSTSEIPLSCDTSQVKQDASDLQQRLRYYDNAEEDKTLIEKVKNFRESNWNDCHASLVVNASNPEHECVHHYVLNDRLFLEPVCREKESKCPVCPSTSSPFTANELNSTEVARNDLPLTDFYKNHTLVTLPKVVLSDVKSSTFLAEPAKFLNMSSSKKSKSEQHCFLTRHHESCPQVHRFLSFDSHALSHQKKVY